MPDLLFFLLLGHFVGDFVLQSDRVAQQKRSSLLALSGHVFTYTLSVALCLMAGLIILNQTGFINSLMLIILVALFVEHWLQDFVRSRWFVQGKQSLYLDQFVHVIILFVLRIYVFPI
jgi:UPF0716 family protein affecting phage T7 exclusion